MFIKVMSSCLHLIKALNLFLKFVNIDKTFESSLFYELSFLFLNCKNKIVYFLDLRSSG